MNLGFFVRFFCLFVCFLGGALYWNFLAVRGLSLLAMSRGYALVAMRKLLIAMASLVAEHRLQGTWTSLTVPRRLSSRSSSAPDRRLSGCRTGFAALPARGIFPDQGSNSCPLHWQILNHCTTREVLNLVF